MNLNPLNLEVGDIISAGGNLYEIISRLPDHWEAIQHPNDGQIYKLYDGYNDNHVVLLKKGKTLVGLEKEIHDLETMGYRQ